MNHEWWKGDGDTPVAKSLVRKWMRDMQEMRAELDGLHRSLDRDRERARAEKAEVEAARPYSSEGGAVARRLLEERDAERARAEAAEVEVRSLRERLDREKT